MQYFPVCRKHLKNRYFEYSHVHYIRKFTFECAWVDNAEYKMHEECDHGNDLATFGVENSSRMLDIICNQHKWRKIMDISQTYTAAQLY